MKTYYEPVDLASAGHWHGYRASDGARYRVRRTYDGWKATREGARGNASGDTLTAPQLAGIAARLAQS